MVYFHTLDLKLIDLKRLICVVSGLIWLIPLLLLKPEPAFGNGEEAAARHEEGRELYNYRCYYCHGYSGNAKTLAASFMTPKPRDFSRTALDQLSRDMMIKTVTEGRKGTAMTSFTHYLNASEIETVVDFIRTEFMANQRENTRYHTKENGWPEHEKYEVAFPFALGITPLDKPESDMTVSEQRGLKLFLTSCISCHDRAVVNDEGEMWAARSVSYPRNNFSFTDFSKVDVDGTTSASVFLRHEQLPQIDNDDQELVEGQSLFQENCAFCHGADGTGKNWIGSFLERRPRDLSNAEFLSYQTKESLKNAIREGVPNTSMPAWKSVLSDVQITHLVNYIYSVLQQPSNKVNN